MPILLYSLELTRSEIDSLFARLMLVGNLDETDRAILDKIVRLMEGR